MLMDGAQQIQPGRPCLNLANPSCNEVPLKFSSCWRASTTTCMLTCMQLTWAMLATAAGQQAPPCCAR